MKWKQATVNKEKNTTIIPNRWIRLHYYEALNALFRIENSLRIFVYVVLKNELLDKWHDINIVSDDSEQSTIRSIARKRFTQTQDFGYLGYPINSPLMYLTSGELIRIINDESYWKYFSKFFPASKQVIKNKLDEIGTIRNSLAHFRPIKPDDVETIKQNANHTLTLVEDCLHQMTSCYNIVPTNNKEEWYLSLNTLGNELCTIRLYQSDDENWIKLNLVCKSKILQIRPMKNHYTYRILKLVSPKILTNFNELAKCTTFLNDFGISSQGSH